MYSTKLLNKSMVSGNAYITVGDPFTDQQPNPFRQPKKGEKVPTPFRTKVIPQNAENGNFAKLTYVAEGYSETYKYTTTQPLDARKKGFGTKDAHKRDEFCNDIRTEQYRETLRKEKALTGEGPELVKEKLTKLLAERAHRDLTMNSSANKSGSFRTDNVHQYDIGRSRTTSFDPKSTKDAFYRFDDENGRVLGESVRPCSYDIGDSAWNITYKPPSHGGKSEVKNFYDKSHLNVKPY